MHPPKTAALFLLCFSLSAAEFRLAAESAPLLVLPDPPPTANLAEEPPLRLAESFGVEPLARFESAVAGARDEVEAIRAWNAAGQRPVRNGFVRPLAVPIPVDLSAPETGREIGLLHKGVLGQSHPQRWVWASEVRVHDAHRLRLRLTDVHLPTSARLWVYGENGPAQGPFGAELAHRGALVTPSVEGSAIRLEVEIDESRSDPLQAIRFTVEGVVQIFELDSDGAPVTAPSPKAINPGCLVDASCVSASTFPAIDAARRAVGQMSFLVGNHVAFCTGALLNDTDTSSVIPYFLTANHCLDSQSSAATLEVLWDAHTNGCGGPVPSSFPRSNGATLLATSPQSDFSLLVLNGIPGGRVLLGWDSRSSSVTPGTVVHRLSHPAPFGDPLVQMYSRSVLSNVAQGCVNPQRHLIGLMQQGGTYGGSSGGPLMLPTGQVVGQLLGGCGLDPEDGCNYQNLELDGWFGHTFGFVSSFLNPPAGGDTSPCTADEFTLCAVNGRFEITSTAPRSLFPGLAGRVSPVIDGDLGGAFHFFQAEKNFHTVVKIALRPSGFYAVSAVALDPLEWTIRIRDTTTGEVKSYTNAEGGLGVPTDVQAFAN